MKKTCDRLRIEEEAAEEMLTLCPKEEKPQRYIRYLAARARFSREAAAFWFGRDGVDIVRFWNERAFRFEAMIDAAKTMREYLEG